MIAKGIRYGYVCTGETFIFLHIPGDDPSVVYYSVSVPNLDVLDDDENRLHRNESSLRMVPSRLLAHAMIDHRSHSRDDRR
ncbi:hypothetical protein GGR54DRAFT_620569 [Hypoxylon sp. NC1633]|nr:hypothetical protein GGR54DRAFT_620569 [Hypoxylon sp. NC1633]